MREITYKDLMIKDLSNLNRWRFAIVQEKEELETIKAELATIKATNYDKMPTGSGDNTQEEKLVTAIARKDQKEAELEYNRRRVADMERLLAQLTDDERLIIERTVICKDQYTVDSLAEDLNCERTNVYRMKNKALMHLAQLRHGAMYQP